MSNRGKRLWGVAGVSFGLAALVWIIFGQTLTHQFINFDDGPYVYRNPTVIRGITNPGIKWAFSHMVAANWHPLTMLSHMLDCSFYGVTPGGHHFTNVLLHTAAAILLFLVFWSMTAALWRSAFVAAVFAVHPLHVESVAWIAERKDVLSGVFFMLTIGMYVQYARRPGVLGYVGILVCFALGLMAKPMLVTLPFVLLLLDYWPLNRLARSTISRLLVEKIPLFLLTITACVETVLSQHQGINLIKGVSLGARVANAFVAVMIYVGQTFWPTDLAVFYPHPENNIPIWQTTLGIAFFTASTVACLVFRKKAPYFLTGWLWYVGMLVPVIGIVQVGVQAHADRYMYLPQIGLSLTLVWAIADVSAQWSYRRLIASAISAGALVPLIWLACIQTSYWRDSESLWEHSVAVTGDNETTREYLSDAYLDKGRIDDAIAQARHSVSNHPESADAHGLLGAALARKGEFDEAITHLHTALQSNPKLLRAHYNLANMWLQKGDIDQAIINYQQELQIQPQFAEGHNNLASALFRKGRLDEAQEHLRAALELNPNNPDAHNNLGIAFSQRGDMPQAIAQWNKTLEIQPDNLEAQCNLAWIFATFPDPSIRNGAKAVVLAERALQLSDRKSARIWRLAAAAYAEAGQFADAIKAAQNALALAQEGNDAALAQTLQANIQQFENNRPLRDMGAAATPSR